MTPDLKALWDSMEITKPDLFTQEVAAILAAQTRYQAVSYSSGVPWQVIGALHQRESSGSFHQHLHNGDSLTARTVHIPKGRPAVGGPPFSWEDSAHDALAYDNLSVSIFWGDIGITLLNIERYNGMGYRNHGILSPYLWSGTNHYTVGKYSDDGHYDPSLADKEPGCAGMLHLLGYGKKEAIEGPRIVITPNFGPEMGI